MQYKAVIFDLDGTLLDTLDDLADSLNQVLLAKGFPPHPLDRYRYLVGNGAATLVSSALPPEKRCPELEAQCLEAFQENYNNNWNRKTKPYPGITELLDSLSAMDLKLAVFTNKIQHFAELCIKEFLTDWEFAKILGQTDGIPLKPDPTGPLEIARCLEITPQEFLYLGDSDVDMITAVKAKMFPVGALWGFRPKKELIEAGAQELIEKPTELLKFIR